MRLHHRSSPQPAINTQSGRVLAGYNYRAVRCGAAFHGYSEVRYSLQCFTTSNPLVSSSCSAAMMLPNLFRLATAAVALPADTAEASENNRGPTASSRPDEACDSEIILEWQMMLVQRLQRLSTAWYVGFVVVASSLCNCSLSLRKSARTRPALFSYYHTRSLSRSGRSIVGLGWAGSLRREG